ncbi:MAG TPA: hypothetical protein VKV15_25840 [Bryobacteraceae bacterium]|nr:hypothetical protein [Bryobacteraceae bacterium]
MRARFRERLQNEFDQRRTRNAHYSLRAFAAMLGADHSSLSQILRGRRSAPAAKIRDWGKRLGLDPEETVAYIATEHMPPEEVASRDSQLRHWTAEAAAILMEPTHWELFRLCAPEWRGGSRDMAMRIGQTVDQVNVALTRLLRLGLVETDVDGAWRSVRSATTQKEFRRLALQRVRAKAAESRIQLPRGLEK